MNYELIKELREAGFATLYGFPVSNSDDGLYYPTLSELIEACGEEFKKLVKNSNGLQATGWDGKELFIGEGKTPEESVAKLWLELNRK